jgi:outer membrane receptor for ferrienterochelin and colicins
MTRSGQVGIPNGTARSLRTAFGALCIVQVVCHAATPPAEEDELARIYGDKSSVSIATGSRQPIRRAPAVATVITAEDIEAIGATDLDEALVLVPGLHVARAPTAYTPIYTFRGIRSSLFNPQVLMLVNGVPVNTLFLGDRGNAWAGLPVENIARIEVIRGPGSALYGADAFAGVINLITKTAANINGTQLGARAGSFKTADAWALHGGKLGPVEVAAYVRFGTTEGQRRTITADAQTGFDQLFGPLGAPAVSRAPGPPDLGRDAFDAALDLSYERWRFRAAYKGRYDIGSGAGIAQALDPTGRSSGKRFTSDLTYESGPVGRDWELSVQASYMYYNERSDLVLFPPGAFGGAFADGMIGNPYKWERHGRLATSALYSGFSNHRIRIGAGYAKEDQYKIRESKNFNPDFSPIGTGSRADVVDVSDTVPFLPPHARFLRYLYVQDEWNLARDWTLTAGVRHDRYSDFGGTTNPRVALVWEAAYNVTAKLLYGSAFRAPSASELYSINNPVLIGNPNLRAEKMKTLEAVLAWQPTSTLQFGANVFRYRWTDAIRLDASFTEQNIGKQTGSGIELEAAWDATRNLRLSGNYGYQRSIDEASKQDAGLAPRQRVYLRGDWRFAPGWRSNLQINHVADRKREPGDTRPAVPDYTTVDLTLRTDPQRAGWDFALILRNLFNADAREPSPFGAPFVQIPNDLPLAGRAAFVEARYKF